MRIAITGASGFIGRHLTSHLKDEHDLVLLGRDAEKLKSAFSETEVADYRDLPRSLRGCDVVLHLAAALPDAKLNREGFEQANLELTIEVAEAAREVNVGLFVNFATLGWNEGDYASTKKAAEAVLASMDGLKIATLRLPAVYGDTYRGRLARLNQIPSPFRKPAFWLLVCLRPAVHINRVGEAVDSIVNKKMILAITVSDRQLTNPAFLVAKSVIDYGFALTVLLLFWWLLLLIYIAIRIESSGPGIFAQTRVGKCAEPFTCYKFRTMKAGTKQAGTHEVSASAVTKVGSFLRKTKLDELPQAINVLLGQLSLIGPRPCLPLQKELITERQKLGVLDVKPGITGLSQIEGIDMSNPKRLAISDAQYLALRTLPMELKILIRTLVGSGSGDRTQ